jgi:arginyl-tRNA synthetase
VVDAEAPDLTRARLILVRAARFVLARVLYLMGMNAPERM